MAMCRACGDPVLGAPKVTTRDPIHAECADIWGKAVAAERARIIALMLAEADALAGRVDSDITTYSGAVALRRMADLIESEVTK